MSEEYDSYLKELDKELEAEEKSSKYHYAKIAYKKEGEKRKKRITGGIWLTVILQLLVFSGLGYFAYSNNFHLRTLYELENRLLGKVTRNSGTYVGSTDFGYFEGIGQYNFSTGTVYSGEWNDNSMSGNGTLSIPDLGEYVGGFANAQKDGDGVFTWADGAVYKGEWHEDELSGEGEYRTGDGSFYKGSFRDNKLYTGTCQFSNRTGSYKIEYFEGVIKKAEIYFKNGNIYVGDSDGNTISGKGKITYINGDSYEGEFLNGKRNGKGKYTWGSGEVYEGEWSDDFGSGTGRYTFGISGVSSGTFENNRLVDGTSYFSNEYGEYNVIVTGGIAQKMNIALNDGTLIDGEGDENGLLVKAKITYSNGDSYNGDIMNGMKHGRGVYKWSKGSSYDGSWENDVMSGWGTYYYTKESCPRLLATFVNGKPEGDATYTLKEAKAYSTTWKDGKCTKVTE